MKSTLTRLGALLAMAWLAGCATPPPVATPASTLTAPLMAFEVSGKIAWQQDGKGDKARFNWRYTAPKSHMDILSPLGSVAATLDAEPGHVVLETAKGDTFTASTLEDLTLRLFEQALPLTGLEYWAQGLPIPNLEYTEENAPEGRRLQQKGWQLDFIRWVQIGERSLPEQVQLKQGSLSLKLILKDWSPTP